MKQKFSMILLREGIFKAMTEETLTFSLIKLNGNQFVRLVPELTPESLMS